MMNRLEQFITLDVTDINESKRASIMVRIQAIVMFLYFFLLITPFVALKEWEALLAGASFLGGYSFVFVITYSGMATVSNWMLGFGYILQAIWITLYVDGGNTGGIIYIILSMMLIFLTSYISVKSKVLITIGYCVLFLGLQILSVYLGPFHIFPVSVCFYIQIITDINIFTSSIAMLIAFSHYSLDSEKKLMDYNREIMEKASLDPLTKLMNRRAADSKLDILIKEYQERGQTFAIAIGDIDFFKKINDTYGHASGDLVLTKTAEIMKNIVGERGFVARWGGEEFLIIMKNMNGDDAMIYLEKIRWTIQETFYKLPEQIVQITMTFGLSEYSQKDGIAASIDKADERLYRGKHRGRNCIIY